ncbi:tRNA (adenosine(37)-N6)-threonylcarbamoyltransferase complex ATPase subunit type 1 TsaE [Lacinutrix sp. C3R15]|uniref:tRNA (adenosine(37)-N6)-threonylcarbamoyltransferase complex ATPase subunit type 1 TsaE n=1 Tax=Flavobacteriaceae TaxID=49546 RepID=UPI001C0A567C|nr:MULTISPECIES: tRNA (adenosine(37)-N6)-threonylcarbamoyltransferase complex ATPase subunit type 1 TsaE [Flavobacteriaceae]MBU2938609.1 tRNA (adenosine(37)-N6)-threonylcarbamoyltransferase complex ATPase subunit type 1 TsaE [Lacinutrix sp. C3R15]MDO6621923.1 tRNA (adenosine(37)-N6)-threonylcarbamoyltransferase complex ATPase subunit type 1 TsaE [Oceanihabitans sp. 1_MG-2023]
MELNYTINDLDKVAKTVLDNSTNKIILFHGTMGVGKTTLIKSLVKTIGSTDEVQSPTYSLVNEYTTSNTKIYHFDLYRVESVDELYNLGFEEYLQENHWVFIEWPELALEFLPENATNIFFELNEDNSRKIIIN